TNSCKATTSVGSGNRGSARNASMPVVWDMMPAGASCAGKDGVKHAAARGPYSGRRRSLITLVATDALDIHAVEDHLQLAGCQLQGGGVGRREVIAATLQALVP